VIEPVVVALLVHRAAHVHGAVQPDVAARHLGEAGDAAATGAAPGEVDDDPVVRARAVATGGEGVVGELVGRRAAGADAGRRGRDVDPVRSDGRGQVEMAVRRLLEPGVVRVEDTGRPGRRHGVLAGPLGEDHQDLGGARGQRAVGDERLDVRAAGPQGASVEAAAEPHRVPAAERHALAERHVVGAAADPQHRTVGVAVGVTGRAVDVHQGVGAGELDRRGEAPALRGRRRDERHRDRRAQHPHQPARDSAFHRGVPLSQELVRVVSTCRAGAHEGRTGAIRRRRRAGPC
jgi:hypothetical protein